jgi:hypothetical protein
LEKETVIKKNKLILNRLIFSISFVFLALVCFSQADGKDLKKKVWKQEKEYLKYQKKKNYKGPEDWYGSSPSSLKEEENNYTTTNNGSSSQGIQYNPQQIKQNREKQFGKNSGKNGGTLGADPEIQKPEPITLPDIDPPNIDGPDLPDFDGPTIPISFWKILLFSALIIAVIILLYWWLKNKQPSNNAVLQDIQNDWNPEVITKTELEQRLEEALERGDFREGIRIYFTFILKELIRKNWIQWKKDKTNHHYLLELTGKPDNDIFRECVRIYDLVWYGEYEIDKDIFNQLQPTLLKYYKSLNPSNE